MPTLKPVISCIWVLIALGLVACDNDPVRPDAVPQEHNVDIPPDAYRDVPDIVHGPLSPALTFEGATPENPGRISIVVGGVALPGGNPVRYSTDNLTLVEDGVVQGYVASARVAPARMIKSDVVIVVDNTTSMVPTIRGVRESVMGFVDQLHATHQDIRIAVVVFNDDLLDARIYGRVDNGIASTDLRSDAAVFSFHDFDRDLSENGLLMRFIENLRVDDYRVNVDRPELCFGGVAFARNALSWRNDAQKIYVVITDDYSWGRDAPQAATKGIDAHYYTDESLANLIKSDGATVHTFCPVRRDWLPTGVYNVSTLSSSTGGTWTQFSSQLDLAALPIAGALGESIRVEFVKNGRPEDIRRRVLRVVVSVSTEEGVVNGDRSMVIDY